MFYEGYWFYINLASMIFYVFISSFTIAGNALVCAAFIKDPYRQLRTLQYYYVLSLAVSDLLMGSSAETLLVTTYWVQDKDSVFFAHYLCAIVSGISSITNMASLSVVRYFVVKMPLTYHRVITRARVLTSIPVIWLFSIHFALLPPLGFTDSFYQIYLYALGCFTPGVVILIAYGGIFKAIRNHTEALKKTVTADNLALRNAVAREKNTTKTMLIVLGVFIAFWCPFLVVDLIMVQCARCRTHSLHVVRDVTLTLTYFSSGINPLLYAWRVEQFRRTFKKFLGIKQKSNRVWAQASVRARAETNVSGLTFEMTDVK